MKKWLVFYTTTASVAVEVEAESAEDAVDNADRVGFRSLCHQEEIEIAGDWEVDAVEELGDV